LEALKQEEIFDIHLESINWGNCSYIELPDEQKQEMVSMLVKREVAKKNNQEDWDILFHVSIPNEWERKAKFNVGITAGIETDRVSHVWIQKSNEMDLIVVPSEHSKKSFIDTVVDWRNEKTGETGELKLNKPIVVCHEGVNTDIFRKINDLQNHSLIKKFDFEPDFNFFTVGQWGKGGFGEDRKNISLMVKYFIETFRGRKDVGLVIKTNRGRNSVPDYDSCMNSLRQIKSLYPDNEVPPIYLIHAHLSDEEMSMLYNHPKIKAFLSFTHGEGFGLPLLEAASCGLPIIATNWSGHLDFLNEGKFSAVEYDMKPIPPESVWNDILIEGSRWAEVIEDNAKHRMKKMVKSYSKPLEWANDLSEKVRNKFNLQIVEREFLDTIKKQFVEIGKESINPIEHLKNYIDNEEDYNVLYTMPMSSGDVFISTAVINGLKSELPDNSKIYFATNPEYASILLDNEDVHKVIPWSQIMMNVDVCEQVFDLVLTPNVETHFNFSNWVRKGQGKRLLAEQYAHHCQCELGNYFIKLDDSLNEELPGEYMTFHPGSGKGQWEARKYCDWQEVINNLKGFYPGVKIVQVGSDDEPKYENIDVDLRGKTSFQQLAGVIKNSTLHLSIDTFSMHVAASLGVSLVALFGSSHASATGPWIKNKSESQFVLLEAANRMGMCQKACYKYQCKYNKEMPCINEIDSAQVVQSCSKFLDKNYLGCLSKDEEYTFKRIYSTISGYTTVYNALNLGIPFEESINSMLGFCDEVVVLDGESDDGTYEILEKMSQKDDRIKLYQNAFDWEEPGIDGMQKAFARALCEGDFLWQQDCDEVVHERDYEKIKMITKRFPTEVDILHLPVIELWGDEKHATGRRHSWKWRMSRNKPEITHAINKHARLVNEETGKVYAKKGMSDGCEYVNVMTYDLLPHTGFYDQKFEMIRNNAPEQYAKVMNQVFESFPSVWHFSWFNIEKKINQLRNSGTWDKLWSLLYQEESQNRFANLENDNDVFELSKKLYEDGGEEMDNVKYKFDVNIDCPEIVKDWVNKNKGRYNDRCC